MKMIDIWNSIIVTLLLLVPSILITKVFSEPIEDLFMDIRGNIFGAEPKINGIWVGHLKYGLEANNEDEKYLFRIKQFGLTIRIRSLASNSLIVDEVVFKGKINSHKVVTGIWKSKLNDERIYGGSFQAIVSMTHANIHGKWLGYTMNNVIYAGDFDLKIVSRNLNKANVENQINDFQARLSSSNV